MFRFIYKYFIFPILLLGSIPVVIFAIIFTSWTVEEFYIYFLKDFLL